MTAVVDRKLKVAGFEQITGLSSAKGLTQPIPNRADVAHIQCEGQDIRWRNDGTNPTATIGMRLITTSSGMWYTGPLDAIRFIEEAATAKINVTLYRH